MRTNSVWSSQPSCGAAIATSSAAVAQAAPATPPAAVQAPKWVWLAAAIGALLLLSEGRKR